MLGMEGDSDDAVILGPSPDLRKVTREFAQRLAKEMAWTRPLVPAPGDPKPFPGWTT